MHSFIISEIARSHIKNFVLTGYFRSFFDGRTSYNVYCTNFRVFWAICLVFGWLEYNRGVSDGIFALNDFDFSACVAGHPGSEACLKIRRDKNRLNIEGCAGPSGNLFLQLFSFFGTRSLVFC